MAISAKKLIYDVERKINAIDSGRANDYRVVDLVSFVNDAYELIIEHLIAEKDQNETIRNHLRPLMVPNYKMTCDSTDDSGVCLSKYPDDFYELINIRATVKKDCCEGLKTIPLPKPQGDDIDEARRNSYRKADFYFEQLPCYESINGLRVYHDGELEVVNVYIDYYRKINRIEAPSLVECEDNIYKKWDGQLIVSDVDFEIDSTYLNRKISDVAAYLIQNASTDYLASNEKLKEILQINQLHK
jgi:hypothetical protein